MRGRWIAILAAGLLLLGSILFFSRLQDLQAGAPWLSAIQPTAKPSPIRLTVLHTNDNWGAADPSG